MNKPLKPETEAKTKPGTGVNTNTKISSKSKKDKVIKKERTLLTIIVVLLAIAALGIGILATHRIINNYNQNAVFSSQTVENLTFSNAKISDTEEIYILSVDVKNNTDTDYNLRTITITLETKDGNVTLTGYIGDSLKPNETKLMQASIDKDITSVSKITYVINR